MSLILEALRKSEAERQRGRAPGLFVEQAPGRVRRARTAPAWAWGLGLLVVVLMAVLGWREWGRGTAPEPVAASLPTGQPSAPVAAPSEAAPAPAATNPTTSPSTPTYAPAPATPAPTATAPAARPGAADVGAAPTPTPPPPAMPAPAPTASAPIAVAEPADPALPTLANLDPAERAQLPSLRLSMHVYAEDPSQRFVILDGQRLGEGASPSPGLVLEQIRRDGLVLSVDGRRLLLPRP